MESYSSIFTPSLSEPRPTPDTASAEQADAFQYQEHVRFGRRARDALGVSQGIAARGCISVRAGDLQKRFPQIKEQIKVGKINRNQRSGINFR